MADKLFAAALDIGTTEIKGSLLDIGSKKELASGSVPNSQSGFGQDLITRLRLASSDEKGLRELNRKAVCSINKLLTRLAEKALIDKKSIRKIAAVGNSAMHHLLLMIKPDSLAVAPFQPAQTRTERKDAGEMGIEIAAGAPFTFLPNVGGFVGSDAIAVIFFTEIHRKRGYSLIMDIGTNGEIILGSRDTILAASCACGPAFEGRHISCGMPAKDGAIVGVKAAKEKFLLKTTGDKPPAGIAGSGLIDLLAALVDKKIIDKSGRMRRKEFVVYSGNGGKIRLTQQDVRQAQAAKAAIFAGAEVLRRRLRLRAEKIKRVYLTGSFGAGINVISAKKIGLIPRAVPSKKISILKDGALEGAKKFLLEAGAKKEISGILAKCEHVELHKDNSFQDLFAAAMGF